jgi:hypothetical protein
LDGGQVNPDKHLGQAIFYLSSPRIALGTTIIVHVFGLVTSMTGIIPTAEIMKL